MTHFRVGIDSEPTDTGYAFASSPYAIYSSTAAYALSLDPVNGDKLVDENFICSSLDLSKIFKHFECIYGNRIREKRFCLGNNG